MVKSLLLGLLPIKGDIEGVWPGISPGSGGGGFGTEDGGIPPRKYTIIEERSG